MTAGTTWISRIGVDEDDLIFLVSMKPIKKEEEFFFDYSRGAALEGDSRCTVCKCMSVHCRGNY